MLVKQEVEAYQGLVLTQMKRLGCLKRPRSGYLWHYTTGSGLLGILDSKVIHATHVACLNDSSEILYGAKLYRDALGALNRKKSAFLRFLLKRIDSGSPLVNDAPRGCFVACFSKLRDDLSQWRAYAGAGGEAGYSLGFDARKLAEVRDAELLKVNYKRAAHEDLAQWAANETFTQHRKGKKRRQNWNEEFFRAWDAELFRLAPAIKDQCFSPEREYRLVRWLNDDDDKWSDVKFKPKTTMLAHYIPLDLTFSPDGLLPIKEILIGPGRHQEVAWSSVEALLRKCKYKGVKISRSEKPLQWP